MLATNLGRHKRLKNWPSLVYMYKRTGLYVPYWWWLLNEFWIVVPNSRFSHLFSNVQQNIKSLHGSAVSCSMKKVRQYEGGGRIGREVYLLPQILSISLIPPLSRVVRTLANDVSGWLFLESGRAGCTWLPAPTPQESVDKRKEVLKSSQHKNVMWW